MANGNVITTFSQRGRTKLEEAGIDVGPTESEEGRFLDSATEGRGTNPHLCLQRPCSPRTFFLARVVPSSTSFPACLAQCPSTLHETRPPRAKRETEPTRERKTMNHSPSHLPSHLLPPLPLPRVHLLLPPNPIPDPFKLVPQHPHKQLRRGGQALHRVRARDAAAGEGEAGLEVAGLFGGGPERSAGVSE